MASVATHVTFPAPSRASRPWLGRRLFEALVRARRQAAEREVARLIETRGGRLTDDTERWIGRHFV